MNKISDLKTIIDQAVQSLAGLGHLTEVLAAAAEVRSSIEQLEAATNKLCLLLVPKTGAPRGSAPTKSTVRPNPYIPSAVGAAKTYVGHSPASKTDERRSSPAREEVKKRVLAKLKKEGQPMSQAALIKTLHHDYYNMSAALASLKQAGEIKEVVVVIKGISGEETKRKVKAYVPA